MIIVSRFLPGFRSNKGIRPNKHLVFSWQYILTLLELKYKTRDEAMKDYSQVIAASRARCGWPFVCHGVC